MARARKLILVSATHHPLHKIWVQVVEKAAEELGLETETRMEDYVLLTEHGATDDLGMTWLPQVLVEMDDGSIKPVLTEMPLNEAYKADPEKAVEEIKKNIKEMES